MFELADRLVGIYKTNDATKSVTVNPRMFENRPLTLPRNMTSKLAETDSEQMVLDTTSVLPRAALQDSTNVIRK